MRRQLGFTTVEIITIIVFVLAIAALFLTRERSTESIARDTQRKTAINAMYYNLEEVYFQSQKYYPLTIDAKALPAMDPSLFKDPRGHAIGEQNSEYRYEPTGCNIDKCSGYTLRADLEREADYIKQSPTR